MFWKELNRFPLLLYLNNGAGGHCCVLHHSSIHVILNHSYVLCHSFTHNPKPLSSIHVFQQCIQVAVAQQWVRPMRHVVSNWIPTMVTKRNP
jgi:hypothetical protein